MAPVDRASKAYTLSIAPRIEADYISDSAGNTKCPDTISVIAQSSQLPLLVDWTIMDLYDASAGDDWSGYYPTEGPYEYDSPRVSLNFDFSSVGRGKWVRFQVTNDDHSNVSYSKTYQDRAGVRGIDGCQ